MIFAAQADILDSVGWAKRATRAPAHRQRLEPIL